MRTARAWVAALGLLLCHVAPARAEVTDHLGKIVAGVRFEIEGRPARDADLAAIVETRVGAPLAMSDVRESVTHLISLGRFDNVVVQVAAAASGVELIYQLTPVHPVAEFSFAGQTGAPGVDTGDLRDALAERFGTSPPARRGGEMAAALEGLLREQGYLRARVTPRVTTTHAPDRATIVFDIDAGVRATLGDIEVSTADPAVRADLLNRLELTPGQPYEPVELDARVERYVADRRADGLYEARLSVTPQPTSEERTVNLLVSYDPGPRVVVEFAGDPVPRDRREELVPVRSEGSADEDLLEDSSNRIVDFFREQGYRDAAAPYRREEANGELRITFNVTRGPLYRVAALEVSGNQSVPFEDLAPLIGVMEGAPFRSARLDTDIAAIESVYRRRGFASVNVQSGVDVVTGAAASGAGNEVPVLVRIIINENIQSIVQSVEFDGNATLGDAVLSDGLGLRPGEPFFAAQMAIDRDAIQLKYADRGFHTATVTATPQFDPDGGAQIVYQIREGPQLFVDHVLIVGNQRTATATIARELQLASGEPFGLTDVTETQRRLAALGLFRRVRLSQVGHGEERRRDLLVSVEEAPVSSIGYGPGLEVAPRIRTGADGVARPSIEAAPRGFFEIGRRNLFGKNRSINFFTSVALQSDESSSADEGQPAPERSVFGFVEYRVLGTFREPQAFGWAADAVLSATVEQQQRSSFNFSRRAFSADLIRRLTRTLSVSGNYQIQRTELFDEQIAEADQLLIDRLFPQVRLSSFASSVIRDSRDDLFDPGAGHYLSANVQLAARRIGSEVGLLKTYLSGILFRTIPRTRGTVFAGSARVGMAAGFEREVIRVDALDQPILNPDGTPVVEVISELPASERFFAGGDTTVRGFALDQLGTPDTFDKDGFPLGGNAVVILNGELRVPTLRNLDAVGFLDAGNVFARTGDIDFGEMRTAIGFGVRYRSPVGPIRLDIGFKLNRREIVPGVPESARAVHISLGQAF